MDFSAIGLAAEDQEFLDRARHFLAATATAEVLRREHESGDGFIEGLHLAMGAGGWLEREAKSSKDGGFTAVQRRIWGLERQRAKVPLETWGGTLMILQAVRRFGSPELLDEVLPGVYRGEVRFAMGYTEPEGGSDIATNIPYYSDVRIPDRYRLGEVNDGWAVLHGPLSAEHGVGDADPVGLADITTMSSFAKTMAETADTVTAVAPVDDESVAYRLGRAHARIEAALSTPGVFGRVAIAQTMRDIAADMMDVIGTSSALPSEAHGAIAGGMPDYLYCWAPLVGIYGGTIDVFRNMIAQYVLGLGRPNYSPSK